jgi:hypothetical protein
VMYGDAPDFTEDEIESMDQFWADERKASA